MTSDVWFNTFATGATLSTAQLCQLKNEGFVILPGPVPAAGLAQLARAYDSAMMSADPNDLSIGRTTTRVHDFVNRGVQFDTLYIHQPVLEACCHVIGRPFKLSSMLGRTLHPHSALQDLHVDVDRNAEGWPMLGFIFMIDDFREDNGATLFVPGSHDSIDDPADGPLRGDQDSPVFACGRAGSMILYHASVWHGHGANRSDQPRRSLQGAYVPREAQSPAGPARRMAPDTLARIAPVAKYLLGV